MIYKMMYNTMKISLESTIRRVCSIDHSLEFIDIDENEDGEVRYDRYDETIDIILNILQCIVECTHIHIDTDDDTRDAAYDSVDDYCMLVSLSCFDRCYPPDDYFFPFEYNRLKFTRYGSLVDTSESTTKMMIGGMIIVRILIMRILLNIQKAYNGTVEETQHSQFNMYIISMILHAVYSYMSNSALDAHTDVNNMKEGVLLGRRIFTCKTVYDRDINYNVRVDTSDTHTHVLTGFAKTDVRDIPYLWEDSNGMDMIVNYIEKVYSNVLGVSRQHYRDIQSYDIIYKIHTFNACIGRMKHSHPSYSGSLTRRVESIMDRYQLDEEVVHRYMDRYII